MKRILLLFTLLLFINAAPTKAQGYHKFLDSSSWCQSINSGFGIPIDYFYYNQSNDTVINTKTYAKIFCTGNDSTFFVREDTVAKKVYIKNNPTSVEVILYDFSLHVGDTLYAKHGWGAGYKLIVRTIDTVTILAGQRRRFSLSDTSGNIYYTTIESVGSINDPFLNNGYPPGDPQYNLVCSYQNNTQVYDANLYGYRICYPYGSQPCDASFTYSVGLNGQVTFTNFYPGYSSYWAIGGGGGGFGFVDTTVFTPSVTITVPCNGTYDFTVSCQVSMAPSGTNTCSSLLRQPITITNVPNSLSASYTYTVGANGQINFTNTSTGTGAPSGTTYWDVYDSTHILVAQSNLASPSFTLATNQYYIVTLSYYPCNSYFSDTIYIANTAGINKLASNNEQVSIYPNPTSSSLQVTFSGNIQNTTIEIYNTIGECVHRQIVKSSNCQIDVSDLSEGIYNISMPSSEGVVNKRVVIVH